MKDFLNNDKLSLLYIVACFYGAAIIFFAGIGALIEEIELSIHIFIFCSLVAFKFFWDGLIELSEFKDMVQKDMDKDKD
jgi:hypothetical protein